VKRGSLSIIVVDDEEPIASAIACVLRRRGHVVRTATSAEAALELEAPDVLISELALPRHSGLDLLEELHQRGVHPHTVFVTARPTVVDCRRALLMGAYEYLVKPFRLEELVRAAEAGDSRAPREEARRKLDHSYSASATCAQEIARDVVAHALASGVGPACRARIGSACAEIADNAARHGYGHGRGPVLVAAELEGREFIVRIRDEGFGFDPRLAEDGCLESPLHHGLARAVALSEDMVVTTGRGKGTEVTLRFDASRVALGDEGSVDLTELDWFTPELSRRVLRALKKYDTTDMFELSPATAVVVGRLLAGTNGRGALETSPRR
jgi:FixJ family two-component response regulator